MTIISLIRSILGPELYRAYKQGQIAGRNYQANNLEYYSNVVISLFRGFYVFCKWTSPIIFGLAYSRSYFTLKGLYVLTHLSCIFGIVYIIAHVTRGLGRFVNKDYREFLNAFIKLASINSPATERKKFLTKYDFELKHWAPDFVSHSRPPLFTLNKPHQLVHSSPTASVKFIIWRVLSKLCVDTFGLKMMYPGVVLQNLIQKPLQDCRAKLIEQMRAQRVLIQTADSYRNKIDTVLVDNRNTVRYNAAAASSNRIFSLSNDPGNNGSQNDGQNGKYLVICCDGNASFYENGIFQLPVENGYSALGWNYPGFGQSTGKPYPVQLTAAADAVIQYAFSLGFEQDKIVLFSWSIGGFAVSWLSNQYPGVRAIILDACFDNIIPLAEQQMPSFASTFVDYAITHNLNLDVANMIKNYKGPTHFIRRTQDEIISTIPKIASTNRGNDLLISTLQSRYPYIVNEDTIPFIRTWLSAKSDIDRMRIYNAYSNPNCEDILRNFVTKSDWSYPIQLGREISKDDENNDSKRLFLTKDAKLALSLYLADKYMSHYETSHCQPLLGEHFRMPWSENDL